VHDELAVVARLDSSGFFACCVHVLILIHPWMPGLVSEIGFNGTDSDTNTCIAMLVSVAISQA
jgi:hypothetical protein